MFWANVGHVLVLMRRIFRAAYENNHIIAKTLFNLNLPTRFQTYSIVLHIFHWYGWSPPHADSQLLAVSKLINGSVIDDVSGAAGLITTAMDHILKKGSEKIFIYVRFDTKSAVHVWLHSVWLRICFWIALLFLKLVFEFNGW